MENLDVKRISDMTDAEFEYWTEHGEIGNILYDAEEKEQGEWVTLDDPEQYFARPDYGFGATEKLWSEIVDGLWQGGTADDDTHHQFQKPYITTKDFDTVVTMYGYANPVDWHVREIRYGVWDGDAKDINWADIFDIVKMAHADWKKGKRVLIRCQAGWNRSGLITALVLIRDGMNARDAIDLIREKRSRHALCNRTFERFLVETDPKVWQGATFGRNTPKKK